MPTKVQFNALVKKDKESFHREGKKFLRDAAKEAGLIPGTYEVRSCKGGPAVRGEVILHHDDVYVNLTGQDGGYSYIRSCNGRNDFYGGDNNKLSFVDLTSSAHLAYRIKKFIGINTAQNQGNSYAR